MNATGFLFNMQTHDYNIPLHWGKELCLKRFTNVARPTFVALVQAYIQYAFMYMYNIIIYIYRLLYIYMVEYANFAFH